MITAYANYTIWFADPAEYAAAIVSGNGFAHCPHSAAAYFGITWPLVGGGPLTGTKGMYGSLPYGIPASPGPGIEIDYPAPSGVFLKSDVDSVIVPGQAGNPPSTWPPGQDMNLKWWGNIISVVNDVGGGVPPTTPIPQRRWIHGWEYSGALEESNSTYSAGGSRIASRTIDGFGLAIRGTNSSGVATHTVDTYRPALQPKTSWERFYIKINALGTNLLSLLWMKGSLFNEGGSIKINNATGKLEAWNAWNATLGTKMGESSAALTLDKWYLIDVLIKFAVNAADVGQIRVYINHVLDIDATVDDGFGLDRPGYHVSSVMGQQSVAETSWELDVDDWMCADVPNNGGAESLDSIDWLVGTHIRSSWIESGTSPNWAGSVLMSNQFIQANQQDTSSLISTTALAVITGLTDVSDEQNYPGVILGPVSAWVGGFALSSIAALGRIGYSIAGGAYVYANVNDQAGNQWLGNYYNPSGLTFPVSMVPLSIKKEKSNDATSTTCRALNAVVEYIGIWGIEDDSTFPLNVSNNINILLHNARYANTMYALGPNAGVPVSSCYAIGGTYVGNGTSTTINLPAPAHFIWIRALAGGSTGVKWFAAGFGGNKGIQTQVFGNFVVRSWVTSAGLAKFTVTGSGDVNTNATTYQYIVFCDPGSRYNYCGVFNRPNAITTNTIPLFDSTFLAKAGFIQAQIMNASGATDTLSFKGPGHTGVLGTMLAGTAITNWGSFAAGALTVKADTIIDTICGSNFSLWRMTDFCGYAFVQITSYTGDGLAFRTINLPYVTGTYPLFAIVVPHDATASYMRDPSHAGNDSCTVGTLTNSITAILGAGSPDQINVGITINTLAVIYDVFVLTGSDTGWNNGIFYPPDCLASGEWIPPPYSPPDKPLITMDGGINFNGSMSLLAVINLSGIYTLVPNKLDDTVYTGFGDDTIDVEIPDPTFKTGYIGG